MQNALNSKWKETFWYKYKKKGGRKKRLRKINLPFMCRRNERGSISLKEGAGWLYLPLYSHLTQQAPSLLWHSWNVYWDVGVSCPDWAPVGGPCVSTYAYCPSTIITSTHFHSEKIRVWMISYKVIPPWAWLRLHFLNSSPCCHIGRAENHVDVFYVCWKTSPEVWKALFG